MPNMIRKMAVNLAVLSSIFIIGCAGAAKVDQMVVPRHESSFLIANGELKDNVHVSEVGGGQETNPLWTSEIGNKEFKAALIQSLKEASYLGSADSNYQLSANLLEVDQPFAGINLTVTTTVLYILTERNGGKEILKETIIASYTAGFSDSVVAVKRLRLANEGSARENIHEFLKALSNLKIEKNQVSISM